MATTEEPPDVLELPCLTRRGPDPRPMLWAYIDAEIKTELERLHASTGLSRSELVCRLLRYALAHAILAKADNRHGRD